MRSTWTLALLSTCWLGACAFQDADTSTDIEASVIPNGANLNGANLNGANLNGANLNGANLNGDSLGNSLKWADYDEIEVGNREIEEAWLDGSELRGYAHHRYYAGADFQYAQLDGRSDTGRHVKLRITEVDPPATGSDLWHYWIEYRDLDHHWYPLCHDDQLAGMPAVAVDGWWSYRTGVRGGGGKTVDGEHFTFACPHIGAIGKCVDAGYEPWLSDKIDQDQQTCVRLLRADYCGDGISHTTNGELVNLYDNDGIQADTENWTLEAEWNADGARCITPHIRQAVPVSCYQQKLSPTCGDPPDWAGGTLIVSEAP